MYERLGHRMNDLGNLKKTDSTGCNTKKLQQ